MRIEIGQDGYTRAGISNVVISHGEQSFTLNITGYSTYTVLGRELLFNDINQVLASLSDTKQRKIFKAYQQISDLILGNRALDDDDLGSFDQLKLQITHHIGVIYDAVSYQDIRSYVFRSGNVELPADLKRDYTDKDRWVVNFEVRTYLREDYIELVILTLALKLMVPVWGAILPSAKTNADNAFKEMVTASLIDQSAVYQYPAMQRLLSYVEATIAGEPSSLSVILGGLSPLETPTYLRAMVLVRRLAIGPVSTHPGCDHLVKDIFNFVSGSNRRLESNFKNVIREKKPPASTKEGDDNSSILDMWKINEETRGGDRMIEEVYAENPAMMASAIAPEIDLERVNVCLLHKAHLDPLDIMGPQIALTQWVLATALSPRSIEMLSVPSQLTCVLITQAVLWEWGFHQLAAIMTAKPVDPEEESQWPRPDPRGKISKTYMDHLNDLYPHYRRDTRRTEYDKRQNVAVADIDKIVGWLVEWLWVVNAPQPIVDQLDNVTPGGQLLITGDIRNQLAELVIHLNR